MDTIVIRYSPAECGPSEDFSFEGDIGTGTLTGGGHTVVTLTPRRGTSSSQPTTETTGFRMYRDAKGNIITISGSDVTAPECFPNG